MRTAIAVALTIAAVLVVRSIEVRQFENRKLVTPIYALEIGEGYCAMDNEGAGGDLAVLSNYIAGDCHAESSENVIHYKNQKTLIGILESPCARGQPCKIIMLDPVKTEPQRPIAVLRE